MSATQGFGFATQGFATGSDLIFASPRSNGITRT
jgi:hypothetical protein